MSQEQGFALIAVLWLTVLLGVMGLGYASTSRLEVVKTQTLVQRMQNEAVLEAAIVVGWHELTRNLANKALLENKKELEERTGKTIDIWRIHSLPYQVIIPNPETGTDMTVEVTLSSEAGKLNLNALESGILIPLLKACNVDEETIEELSDAILDWIDTDDLHRLHGAENEDYYSQLEHPYLCKNGPIETIEELLHIKGMTHDIIYGTDAHPGLTDFISVFGGEELFDINNAPRAVFSIIEDIPAEVVNDIIVMRNEKQIQSLQELAEIVPVAYYSQLQKFFAVHPIQFVTVKAVLDSGVSMSRTRNLAGL